MRYTHVLLTHDGSELSDSAVEHAEAIANAFQAKVTVLRVTETVGEVMVHMAPTTLESAGPIVADVAEDVVASERATAERDIEAVAALLATSAASAVETLVKEGAPGSVIVDTAVEIGADLIVMATHGRSGLSRAVMGSVADHVLHNAPCPVLLCRATD